MNIVIGSGPAGIACTYALLEKNKEVLVVDAGLQLEKEQSELLGRIRTQQDAKAVDELIARQDNPELAANALRAKLVHGSDFPYRGTRENLDLESSGTGLAPSLAVGGFSNVWGAAALPYRQGDISDWPITERDLASHYEKVIAFTGLSATRDDLTELFPLHTSIPSHLEPSSQARDFLKSLSGIRTKLQGDGVRYGASRLMVGPSRNNEQACVYCGQCIYGCPYGCIYNSGDDLVGLLTKNTPGLRHRTNVIATSIKEKGNTVTVSGFDRLSKEPISLEGERAFLAAGVIPSSRIMLKSMELYDTPVTLRDSQYFLFPIVSLAGNRNAVKEAKYTLSQVFMEIEDENISPQTVHLQVYTYNDIITKTLEHKFRFLPLFNVPLARQLDHRVLIVQGYLHSQHSGKIDLCLHRDPATSREHFEAKGIPAPEARAIIGKIIKKLARHLVKLGLFPMASALEFCQPGRGFHSGGSFPMRRQPGPLESDIYGRVGGASRIHMVDASIFPSIPATTITLTAMANAHRIGSSNE